METSEVNPLDKLNARQRRFVVEYLDCLNASEAARRAGYSVVTAYQIGWRLLRNVDIAAAVSRLGEQMGMSAGEAVRRLAEMGRGSLIPFVSYQNEPQLHVLTGEPILDDEGKEKTVSVVRVDLNSDQARSNLHLLRKIKQGAYGLEIEIHDPKDALDKILQLHGRYKQVPGDLGTPKQVSVYILPDGNCINF